MIIIKYIKDVENLILNFKNEHNFIGFVPTMGALHEGHISLINESARLNEITVCSIFVNPTQFNNISDLQKYPITIEADIDKIEQAGCNILFLPDVKEMYPDNETSNFYELGTIETILEGFYRPGHFQGVCTIVDRLLIAIKPHALYLGSKDYQQCLVIKKMIALKQHDVNVHICDTVREKDGLAMSSRNLRLNDTERMRATKINEVLLFIKNNIAAGNLKLLKQQAQLFLETNGYKVDYTEIADAKTLEIVNEWDGVTPLVVLVAAYLNEVRLIDNIIL